jgi:hypothetical protein
MYMLMLTRRSRPPPAPSQQAPRTGQGSRRAAAIRRANKQQADGAADSKREDIDA